jgi:hypothetical protein
MLGIRQASQAPNQQVGCTVRAGYVCGILSPYKGSRVRLRDRVVVTPHVHFVEEESGAATLSLPVEPVPKEVGVRPVHGEPVRDVMMYRDEVMESESSDLEEDHHSPLILSPGPVSPAHVDGPVDSTVTQIPHGPTPDNLPQDLTHMVAKLQLAARDGGAATSNVSGIRTRAQATVRHQNGAPVPSANDQPKARDGLQPYCPLTRAQRLEQRNAKKEILQNGEFAEAGISCGSSGEMEVSAQFNSKTGEAVTECTDCGAPGEVIDIVESARCVLHEVVADCIYGSDSDDDEILLNDKNDSPRTRFGQVVVAKEERERDETPVRFEHSAESVTSRSVPGLPSSPRRVPLSRTFISGPGSFLPKILHISGPGSFLPLQLPPPLHGSVLAHIRAVITSKTL